MKQKSFWRVSWLLLVLWAITACGGSPEAAAVEAEATPTVEFGTPVEVADVETGDITLIYAYNGGLQPKDEVSIVPSLGGKVDTLLVEVGDEVKAGDSIATIEQDVYLAQLKQAEAGLKTAELNLAKMKIGSRPEEIAVAQAAVEVARAALNDVATIDDNERTSSAAALARAQSALRIAQTNYDKIAWAGDVGATREAQALEEATIAYEDALADYTLQTNPSDSQLAPLLVQLAQAELNLIRTQDPFRETDFAIAEAGIEQAKAGVELAQIQVDHTTIEAPFDGLIADLFISQGSTVGPQSPLARFVSKEIEVEIEVEESRINDISEGQNVSLKLTAYPDQDFPATVTSISPVADENTRTFTVKVAPLDEAGVLRSGMFAAVSVLAAERQNTTLIPRDALIQLDDGGVAVYVVEAGQAHQRTVEIGISDGERIEILAGLEPGEVVVVSGQPNLTDGVKVEVTNRL
jgi:HlyD family secretion protein